MKPTSEYFAVIFTSQLSGDEVEEYSEMAKTMEELATAQEGFLGLESTRNEAGFGITISYWKDEESIRRWKLNSEHIVAQKRGREKWYSFYSIRIAKVSREYQFPTG